VTVYLGREEIERMLGLSEFREEAQALILRQLTRRIGSLAPEVRSQVQALSLTQLESLGEALLDFSEVGDLERWLREN
jgi:predicted transposase YdaD